MGSEDITTKQVLLGLHKKVDRLSALVIWTLIGVAGLVGRALLGW